MLNLKTLVLIALTAAIVGCGQSKQEELAAAQLKALQETLQEAQKQTAENQKKKDASLKALTGGDSPTWNFDGGKK